MRPIGTDACGGIDGRLRHCHEMSASVMGTSSQNTPRQPITPPSQLPSGAAKAVATAFPMYRMPTARGTESAGTSRIRVAVESDQNPPIVTPSSARAAISSGKLGASAISTSDTSIVAVRPISTWRRSIRPQTLAISRLVATANKPETEIA